MSLLNNQINGYCNPITDKIFDFYHLGLLESIECLGYDLPRVIESAKMNGFIRFNSINGKFEIFYRNIWKELI